MIKRLYVCLLALALTILFLAGCVPQDRPVAGDGLSIISTIFPGYDFARQICGDKATVTILLPPGAESHSYEPSLQQILKIQSCDLFIYVGGEADVWVDKILNSLPRPIRTLKMMGCVQVVEEKLFPGMQIAPDDEPEYDAHVWTAPANAAKIARAIGKALCEIDAENKIFYENNLTVYLEQLKRLDQDFRDFFAGVENKTLVVCDRFPFRYFAEAYGLNCYAAFPGCAAESEPSARSIVELVDAVVTEGVTTVFYIEFSNRAAADSVAELTHTKTALLHSCHNVSPAELANGVSYISLMEQNLATLREAMI